MYDISHAFGSVPIHKEAVPNKTAAAPMAVAVPKAQFEYISLFCMNEMEQIQYIIDMSLRNAQITRAIERAVLRVHCNFLLATLQLLLLGHVCVRVRGYMCEVAHGRCTDTHRITWFERVYAYVGLNSFFVNLPVQKSCTINFSCRNCTKLHSKYLRKLLPLNSVPMQHP